jgi:hypothetical protein
MLAFKVVLEVCFQSSQLSASHVDRNFHIRVRWETHSLTQTFRQPYDALGSGEFFCPGLSSMIMIWYGAQNFSPNFFSQLLCDRAFAIERSDVVVHEAVDCWFFEIIVPVATPIFKLFQNDSNIFAMMSVFVLAGFVLGC